jgi:hypothetical protein
VDLGVGEPDGRESLPIGVPRQNLAVDRLALRRGDRAVVDELLNGDQERVVGVVGLR